MSKKPDPLAQLSREERIAICREVMERLSDLVEGEAPRDFCERVDELFTGCQPYDAYRKTLEVTIRLARECRDEAALGEDDEASFLDCVEAVRKKLR